MALQLHVAGSVGLGRFNSRVRSLPARKVNTFATLSQPRSDAVNGVEATNSFFDQDKRPIMLFDGNQASIILFLFEFPLYYMEHMAQ